MRTTSLISLLSLSLVVFACAEGGDSGSGGGVDANCVDADADTFYAGLRCTRAPADCNDQDRAVNPGAVEVPGNGKDDDCRGGDAALPSDCTRDVDRDRDGYYDQALKNTDREPKNCRGEDCDDNDRNINPRQREIPNDNKDNDCNPQTPDVVANCIDRDGDNWGADANNNQCTGRVANDAIDCDDNDASRNPGAREHCNGDGTCGECDGKDNNCNGKIDECDNDSLECDPARGRCLGKLNAACSGHLDCGSNFRCKGGRCLIYTQNDECGSNEECFTGACGTDSLRCAGNICEVIDCSGTNVCGEAKACSEEKGRCIECEDSTNEGPCGCGLCAGYRCYEATNANTYNISEPSAEEDNPVPSVVVQVMKYLTNCFSNKGAGGVVFCGAFGFDDGVTDSVAEDVLKDYICDTASAEDFGGADGAAKLEAAKDMCGCSGFLGFGVEMRFGRAIAPGRFYEDCVWYDNEVRVDECSQFPTND